MMPSFLLRLPLTLTRLCACLSVCLFVCLALSIGGKVRLCSEANEKVCDHCDQ